MMIVVMKKKASARQIGAVITKVESFGCKAHISEGTEKTIIGVMGNGSGVDKSKLIVLDGVEDIIPILKPFKLTSREFKSESTIVSVKGVKFGGKRIVVIAGPCAVESYEQTLAAGKAAKKHGATLLRGGAFKPRTSPYAFQGKGKEGLEILSQVKKETGLPIVSEVISPEHVELVARYVDVLQIGARNMQNFALLEAVGKCDRPVLLKRGMMSTVEELLMSAEYLLANGNRNVILCERGIRTFEKITRNTPDLAAIPVIKNLSHLPVIFDPSHSTGKRELITPMSSAALACGADGIIVEIHPAPEEALCDGDQSLTFDLFGDMMKSLSRIAAAVERAL